MHWTETNNNNTKIEILCPNLKGGKVVKKDKNSEDFCVYFVDISMQDKMVIYDNEKQTIGWIPANCDNPPRSNTIIF